MSHNSSLYIVDGWVKQARFVKSPNFNQRPENAVVNAIIIHAISLPPGQFGGNEIERFFCNQLDVSEHCFFKQINNLQVSAHFLIRRSGEVVQFVNTDDRAWHAGVSSLDGEENCNNFSIGIELEGTDHQPFEIQQYQSLIGLVNVLKDTYPNIIDKRIVGHVDIAPGRKTDPGKCFDWNLFRRELALAQSKKID